MLFGVNQFRISYRDTAAHSGRALTACKMPNAPSPTAMPSAAALRRRPRGRKRAALDVLPQRLPSKHSAGREAFVARAQLKSHNR